MVTVNFLRSVLSCTMSVTFWASISFASILKCSWISEMSPRLGSLSLAFAISLLVFHVFVIVFAVLDVVVLLGAAAPLLEVLAVLVVVVPLFSMSASHLPAGVVEVVFVVEDSRGFVQMIPDNEEVSLPPVVKLLGMTVLVFVTVALVLAAVTLSLRSIWTNLSSSTSVSFVLDSPILQLSQSTVSVRAGCGLSAFNLVNVPINHSAILAAMR